MIEVTQADYIRDLHFKEGMSARSISQMTGVSRNTISKILNAEDTQELGVYHLSQEKPSPVMDAVASIIDAWLEADKHVKPKQRHTAKRIYDRLVDEHGFTGGESTVRKYVAKKRKKIKDAYNPLAFAHGEAAQLDWGEAEVIMGRIQRKVNIFCYQLSHSSMPFIMAFPDTTQEALFQGHHEAFTHLGGVPQRIIYDNMKTAVKKILKGSERVEQDQFTRMKTHYLFRADFCNPRSGWEKGKIENLVGFSRRNFLVPIPEVEDFQELNTLLWERSQKFAKKKKLGSQTLWEVWHEEKDELQPLPLNSFECCTRRSVNVNPYSLVEFQTNFYSVPVKYAHKPLELKAFVDTIELYIPRTKECVATHKRLYSKNQESLVLDHYLELLAKKPRALTNAKVIQQLPSSWKRLLEFMKKMLHRGDKEFIRMLFMLRTYPQEIQRLTVETALTQGIYIAEEIHDRANKLEFKLRGVTGEGIKIHSELPPIQVSIPNLNLYDRLLGKEVNSHDKLHYGS